MIVLKLILVIAINIICISAVSEKEVTETVEWAGGPFVWPDTSLKSLYKSSGRYINKNIIATRFQIHGDCAYVALPRYKPGVSATLARVSLHPTCEAVLEPFPCLLSQDEKNCKALQSVVDLFIDRQGVLWVLDIGIVNTIDAPFRHCPPKVVAISLETGKVLKTIDLSGLVCQASRLQYVVCEYTPENRPVVYVTDAAARSILVYDVVEHKGYRVVLPKAVTSGCNRRDVLYMALVRRGCGNNFLIFTYLCSKRVFSIRTDYLRSGSADGQIVDLGLKPNNKKIVILGTDGGAAIFFRYEGENDVYRWDANTCFTADQFMVVYKSSPCFLVTQAAPDIKKERIRVLQSNFPDYIQHTVGCGAVQQINIMAGNC